MFMSAWKFVDSWIAPGIEAGSDPQHKCLHEIPDGFKKYETGKTAFPGPHSHTSDIADSTVKEIFHNVKILSSRILVSFFRTRIVHLVSCVNLQY